MIERKIRKIIAPYFFKGKALIILGPRQVGKTTLLKVIKEEFSNQSLFLNCDEPLVREQLTNASSQRLKNIVKNKKMILIDEAQRVKNIGLTLKLFIDNISGIQLIVTGSSALDVTSEITEPLTGRKFNFTLLGLSWQELVESKGYIETNSELEDRIIYGMYPEVVTSNDFPKKLLEDICESYLFKDIFSYEKLRRPELLEQLVTALALQLGQQVSYHELANLLKVDNETIRSYIDVLEKSYIIFRLPPYSRNVRSEISKMRKIYFYDTGIRNALLDNYNPLNMRSDTGALWENFLISERIKRNIYNDVRTKTYFWRSRQQAEVDYIEEKGSELESFEFKWNPNATRKIPKQFTEKYKIELNFIDSNNFNEFLINEE